MSKLLMLEDSRIGYKNFTGRAGKFNKEGSRNFVVFLDPDKAQELSDEGWNVKFPVPRDDDDERDPYLPVEVKFDPFPPTVIIVAGETKTPVNADGIEMLDNTTIDFADLVITAFDWEVNGNTGRKAYLKKGYMNIELDPFISKYGL